MTTDPYTTPSPREAGCRASMGALEPDLGACCQCHRPEDPACPCEGDLQGRGHCTRCCPALGDPPGPGPVVEMGAPSDAGNVLIRIGGQVAGLASRRPSDGRWQASGIIPSASSSSGGAYFALAADDLAGLRRLIEDRIAAHRSRS